VFSGPPTSNGLEAELGARVRTLRRERGLTLKGLGRLAGLSHPFLSQVERGLAKPSMSSIERIAAALDVSVAHLWSPPREQRAVRVIRADEGPRVEQEGATFRELPGEPAAPALREWSAANRRWPEQGSYAGGEVAIYVARGMVEVDVAGTVTKLGEGDTLRFDGALRHRLRRLGGPTTRALIVSS
jgi:transcriptional regulator with XRE-family HTH domain